MGELGVEDWNIISERIYQPWECFKLNEEPFLLLNYDCLGLDLDGI